MPAILFRVNGTLVPAIRFQSVSIHDVLGAAPNTATLTFDNRAVHADVGAAIQIGAGSLTPPDLLFAGQVQHLVETYQADVRKVRLTEWPADLIDHVFALNRRRPFASYVNVSATTIAQALVSGWAPGFTTTHVQAGLPALTINFDGATPLMECLNQVAQAVGGRTKIDYLRDVHLFLPPEVGIPDPDPIGLTNPPLNVPPIQFDVDLSQVRTRVYGKGHGETTPTDVLANETIIPVESTAFFNVAGGRAIAGLTSDGAQTQRWTYTGVQAGGSGTLVGPGIGPAVAPAVALAAAAGLGLGTYQYAYTHVTATGESLPSPLATIATTDPVAAPALALTSVSVNLNNSNVAVGDLVYYAMTYLTGAGETLPGPVSNTVTIGGPVSGIPNGTRTTWPANSQPAGITAGRLYRNRNGVWDQYVPLQASHFSAGSQIDNGLSNTAGTPPAANTTAGRAVTLASIAIGVAAVTARKVYRTTANGAQLKLVATIANNTATTYADTTADGALGANAPTGDTSGLTQPAGQVQAGSVTLPTAGLGALPPGGGWVRGGQQIIRYAGTSGNTLTGIPATGPGAITTTMLYGDQVIGVPALTGVVGNTRGLQNGSTVAIFVQRDDLEAQAALGQLERNPDGTPTDGIREYLITDERRSEPSLIDRCDADLEAFARPIIGVTYATRDPKSKAGQTAHLDLRLGATGVFNPAVFNPAVFHTGADPGETFGYAGDFLIQEVTITIDPTADPLPRYLVRASSSRFTFQDLLQRVALIGV